VLKALPFSTREFRFAHGAQHRLPNEMWLIDSYHCSRYNTQTKRLTEAMFRSVFADVAAALGRRSPPGSS
jgi:uracil-DNA glycosylase